MNPEPLAQAQTSIDSLDAAAFPERSSTPIAIKYPTCREAILKDGSKALEMHVVVDGNLIRAVISESSYNKSRSEQILYAEELGGRLATEKENFAVASYPLIKKQAEILNPLEQRLQSIYIGKYVRDSVACVIASIHRVWSVRGMFNHKDPNHCALIVLPSEESKE